MIPEEFGPLEVKKYKENIGELWDRASVITYSAERGQTLRVSDSLEENASFLVRWASEMFGEWSTWLQYKIPGVKTGFK